MAKKAKNELIFLPLGGCGEIGMNLNLYGFGPVNNRKWIIVDIGVTFGSADTPGVEIIMPNIDFILSIKSNLLGIILTHAHEDHMGALARLWPQLRCPVYATPFTMYLVKDRLSEFNLLDLVELNTIELKSKFNLGPFAFEFINMTHSIAEPNALAIKTELGTILHTGDWKIDEHPQIGEPIDSKSLRHLGESGVLAMVCDSTNVFSEGFSGSEQNVRKELVKLVGEYPNVGISIASFASNIARLESVMIAAKLNGRSVCLVGRSMKRMAGAAKSIGMLSGIDQFITEDEANAIPASHVLYLCTGSQGESRAALSRIANHEHRNVKFHKGDVVIFSSKVIPGNEVNIYALQNKLAEKGVEIVTEKMRNIHVSGHPCREELKKMYEWVRPIVSIPVHGERRHLIEHSKLSKLLGVKHSVAPKNGEMYKITRNGVEVIDVVTSGRLHQDGLFIVSDDDSGLRARRKIAYSGHISVSLVYNANGKILSGPEPRAVGIATGHNGNLIESLLDGVSDVAELTFNSLSYKTYKDEDLLEEKLVSKIKRYVKDITGKRTQVEVIVHKVV